MPSATVSTVLEGIAGPIEQIPVMLFDNLKLRASAWWLVHGLRPLTPVYTWVSGRKVGQATKGTRWMPWREETMKDVASCDKPRGAAKQALIRGCPNGETRLRSCGVIVQ